MDETKEYDCFISHASEDKENYVDKLISALRKEGLKVWYDKENIVVGDSLTNEINNGLKKSVAAVVVLSPFFLQKQWTKAELETLLHKQIESGERIILPIWHNVTREEVEKACPLLVDSFALNSKSNMKENCQRIKIAVNKIKGILPIPEVAPMMDKSMHRVSSLLTILKYLELDFCIIMEFEDWVNKSLNVRNLTLYIYDGENDEIIDELEWCFKTFPCYDFEKNLKKLLPWVDFEMVDDDYDELEWQYAQEIGLSNTLYIDEDDFKTWLKSLPALRPYDSLYDEVEKYRIKLTLNEMGRIFLKNME